MSALDVYWMKSTIYRQHMIIRCSHAPITRRDRGLDTIYVADICGKYIQDAKLCRTVLPY